MLMAKRKIADIVEEISSEFLAENGLELYNCEFVKEGRDWFLRVYIDKTEEAANAAKAAKAERESADSSESSADEDVSAAEVLSEYVSTDDCEKVSRFLSAELDRLDPIEQNYYLEVSSPGMDRALLKEKDFVRFAGEIVDVSLYKALDGRKAYQGKLVGMEDGKIIITDENDKRIEFPREQVAKTKLAVIF
jgi:ribosome maturation factor RimP